MAIDSNILLAKRLNAAHHRWQRSILVISWKDRITNVEVRTRTGQQTVGFLALFFFICSLF